MQRNYEEFTVRTAGILRVPRDPTPSSVRIRISLTTAKMEFREHPLHSNRQHSSEGKIKKHHSSDKLERAQVTKTVHRDKPFSRKVRMLKVWKLHLFGIWPEFVALCFYFFSSKVLFPGSSWVCSFQSQNRLIFVFPKPLLLLQQHSPAGPGRPVLSSRKTSLPPPPSLNY